MKRVYFIKPVGMDGPIKVGCSYSPAGRRAALATWSPFALEIVAEIEGDYDLEHRFHALFIETHQRREWFGWSKRIAATISAINDGTFDVATLPAPIHVSNVNRKGRGSRKAEWTPARRFSAALYMRMYALRDRGMPWAEHCAANCYFSQHGEYDGEGKWGPHSLELIKRCEAHADEMTAKYGHAKMKPVRWPGEYPQPRRLEQAA